MSFNHHIVPKRMCLVFTIMMFLWICPLSVLADNGDSSGGGKGNPISLVSSSPADGQKDVSINTEIKLSFSKNVVNMTVKDNNLKCFSLTTSEGTLVPIEVKMADDQMEPEFRNDVVLVPGEPLKEGTTYCVKISPELKSKSGVNLQQEVFVNFTTVAASPSQLPEKQTEAPKQSVQTEPVVLVDKESISVEDTKDSSSKEQSEKINIDESPEQITNEDLPVSSEVSSDKVPVSEEFDSVDSSEIIEQSAENEIGEKENSPGRVKEIALIIGLLVLIGLGTGFAFKAWRSEGH